MSVLKDLVQNRISIARGSNEPHPEYPAHENVHRRHVLWVEPWWAVVSGDIPEMIAVIPTQGGEILVKYFSDGSASGVKIRGRCHYNCMKRTRKNASKVYAWDLARVARVLQNGGEVVYNPGENRGTLETEGCRVSARGVCRCIAKGKSWKGKDPAMMLQAIEEIKDSDPITLEDITGVKSVSMTPEHRFLTQEGWERADELKPGTIGLPAKMLLLKD